MVDRVDFIKVTLVNAGAANLLEGPLVTRVDIIRRIRTFTGSGSSQTAKSAILFMDDATEYLVKESVDELEKILREKRV